MLHPDPVIYCVYEAIKLTSNDFRIETSPGSFTSLKAAILKFEGKHKEFAMLIFAKLTLNTLAYLKTCTNNKLLDASQEFDGRYTKKKSYKRHDRC